MLLALVSSFFVILNIILWFLFLSKFKKFFSTDEVLDNTRAELEYMVSDLNRIAERNIDIIDDRIKQLKAVVAEADRHILAAQNELEKQRNAANLSQRLNSRNKENVSGNLKQSNIEKYRKNSAASNVYSVTSEGEKQVNYRQAELFDQVESNEIISESGTRFSVENQQQDVTSIPVLIPNVSFADEPIERKKTYNELVHDLYVAGHSIDEIAVELNSSTTEVQLVLDMDF